jgi:site-specific recombinase XerD
MSKRQQPRELEQIFEMQLQTLAATLRPNTIRYYRVQANRFLRFLQTKYPAIRTTDQLGRNPHVLGWLRSMAEENPPLTNRSRLAALICVRRLFYEIADSGYLIEESLILPQDFPPRDLYLPKPISPEIDLLLDRELRKTDGLLSNALLLLRATGMRVGECLRLDRDSIKHVDGDHWALHVPLGKLHNERWVPIDSDAHKIFDRLLSIGDPAVTDQSGVAAPLLVLPNGHRVSYHRIRQALVEATRRIPCPPIRLHQLRHTYATAMLRAGISLPVLKELLGHKDIRMTMIYVQVTQNDLQREYHQARQRLNAIHAVPQLPTPESGDLTVDCIRGACRVLDAIKHQMEMYRRQLADEKANHRLRRLLIRLGRLRIAFARFQKTK